MVTDPNSQWYYSRGGNQLGPVPLLSLRAMITSGQLNGGDLVWTDGMTDWLPIANVPALFAGTPSPQSAPIPFDTPGNLGAASPSPAGYAGGQPVPYYTPSAAGYSRIQGESQQGMAVAGFVLSLTFWPLGIVFSIIALNAMKRTGNYEGKGLATAGLIISLIPAAILVIVIVVIVGIICVGGFH